MFLTSIAVISMALFTAGYLIGRTGHFFLGHKITGLDHWIYGIIIIAAALALDFSTYLLTISMVCFGLGVFVSDIKDFVNLKFYGRDKGERKFWGFD